MGERLYVTGYKMYNKDSCTLRPKVVSKECCFGKLYYYANMHEMRSADFLLGVIAGRIMEEALIDCAQYDDITEKEYLENEEGLYSWGYNGGFEGSSPLVLTRSMMRRFTELYIEDKIKFNIYPMSKEDEEKLLEFVENYEYFTLEHGG